MAESRFVYVTYIRTTPEKLWQALTDPEFTRKYWVETWQDCAWKKGASWKLMAPDGRVALIEPYLGMLGHAVVRCNDGSVFAHLHPMGTFSMAARDFFITGKTPRRSVPSAERNKSSFTEQPSEPIVHDNHTNEVGVAQGISFPYAFPSTGSYCLWVQMKSQGRILTGVFHTTVTGAN